MKLKNLLTPRVLIVEDILEQLQGINDDLDKISIDGGGEYLGIETFVCDLAEAVDEAEGFITDSKGVPYDFLLLDLGLPKRKGEVDLPENGEKLLEKVRLKGAAKEIIVISVWDDVEHVVNAFRSGAIDFVSKPFKTAVLQARFIDCWKRLLGKESEHLLGEDRIGHLVPYAEKGLAHRFTKCFSNLVQSVAHGAEDIESYMHERYGLDRRKDSQDFFFKCLKWQEDSVVKAKNEWEDLQTSLQPKNESSRVEVVETLLEEIHRSLLPCFIIKNVELELTGKSAAEVLTFDDDVRAVLREIIAGALDKFQDYNESKQVISVKVESQDGQAKVSIIDHLERISPRDTKDINEGSNVSPDRRFGREWGLSVVQHIAMRGGGRLEIKPQARGNAVTYFIPLAN
jgi:CheY-like chemotaxis protein